MRNPRDDHPDVGNLGQKVVGQSRIAIDREIAPGVMRGADGRLYTAIPENEMANVPVWVPPVDIEA